MSNDKNTQFTRSEEEKRRRKETCFDYKDGIVVAIPTEPHNLKCKQCAFVGNHEDCMGNGVSCTAGLRIDGTEVVFLYLKPDYDSLVAHQIRLNRLSALSTRCQIKGLDGKKAPKKKPKGGLGNFGLGDINGA